MHQPINLIHIGDTLLSDAHKDAFGFRPRGLYKDWWTHEELEGEYDSLWEISRAGELERMQEELECQKLFEGYIDLTIEVGAKDRATAFRWMTQGEGYADWHNQDIEHMLWKKGIGFDIMPMYIAEIRGALS